tara:strand:- start:4167 stop:5126 length:960 start_codon:yes stop_codon:yes gene_type:complete
MNTKDFLNWAQGAQNNMSPECWDSTTDKEKENIEEIRSLFRGSGQLFRGVKRVGGKFGRTAIGGGMWQGAFGPEGKPGAAGTERQGGFLKTVGHTFRTAYGDKSPSLQDRVRASRAYSGAGADSAVAGDKAVAVSDDEKAIRGERFRRIRDVAIEKMKRKRQGKPLTVAQRVAGERAEVTKQKERYYNQAQAKRQQRRQQRTATRQQTDKDIRRAMRTVAKEIPKDAQSRIRSSPERMATAARIMKNVAASKVSREKSKFDRFTSKERLGKKFGTQPGSISQEKERIRGLVLRNPPTDLRSGRTTNSRGRDLTSGSTRT